MVLYVLNRNEEVVGTLSNEDLSNPTLLSATVNKKINNMSTLSLTVSKNTDFIKEENFIIYKDTNDEWNLYIIREINESHSEGFTKDILCEDGSQELLDNLSLHDMDGSTSLPSVLLEKILQGTRWSVGRVDNPTSTAEIKNTKKGQSVLESIYTICDQYGLEAKFTYNVTNNKITKRTVSLLAIIGNDRGKRFEYTKDIESIERIVDSTEIRTAVAVYGGVMEEDKDKPSNEQRILDIVNIAWTSNDGLCSTEIGKNYIEIKGATNTWGYVNSDGSKMPRIGRYENNGFTVDREGLCDHAYEVLKKHKDPKVTYKIDAVDLYALTGDTDFAHERVGIGDVVRVVDKEFRPYLLIETRIIEITENLLDPSDLKLSLGDKVKTFTDSNALDMDKQISDKVINILQNNVYNGLADLEQKVEDLSRAIGGEDTESYSETLTVATTEQGTFERKIEIDPVVLECINTEIDYIVDIHKVGWGDYRIKEQARDYFIVESDREDFKFKYTIKGKRIGFEDMRLVKSVANVMAMAEHEEPKTRDIDMNELCDDVEHEVFIR